MVYLDVRRIDDYRICLGFLDLEESVSLGKSGPDYQRKLEKSANLRPRRYGIHTGNRHILQLICPVS